MCGDDSKLPPLRAALRANPALKVFVSTWSAPPEFKDQRFTCVVKDGMDACAPAISGPPAVVCNATVADPNTCNSSNKQGVPCVTDPPTHVVPKPTGVKPGTTAANAGGNCYNTGFVTQMQAWANHFKRFIEDYTNASVPIWGVTAQNEPLTQTGMWGANFYTADNETSFIADHLAPTLRAAFPGIKIMAFDDQVRPKSEVLKS